LPPHEHGLGNESTYQRKQTNDSQDVQTTSQNQRRGWLEDYRDTDYNERAKIMEWTPTTQNGIKVPK
jgi:hypothetical protein